MLALALVLLAAAQAYGAPSATRRQQAAARCLNDAAAAAYTMRAQPGMRDLLARARGVYIAPLEGCSDMQAEGWRAGVLVARRADGRWGNPAFFDLATLDAGPRALLLMNEQALAPFRGMERFVPDADSDLIVWYRKGTGAPAAAEIRYNPELTAAYYGKAMGARQAIDGSEANPQADVLRVALGAR